MYLLITYDVETLTSSGRRRLRQVAKCCLNYGQRVQNSVFECSINGADFVSFKSQLNTLIDHEKDTIRIYHLGKNYNSKIEQLGKSTSFDFNGELII
jgi:CRISPR-associated protein Cas2